MDVGRIARHLMTTHWRVRRAFPRATLEAIEGAIRASEARHAGEIRFVVEGALDIAPLLRGQAARERALDVFSSLRIWDTENNNGVLIYLLLADHAVEVIADRGIHARVGDGPWQAICRDMEAAFRRGDYRAGVLGGIDAVNRHLAQHYPAGMDNKNELPDRPIIL
jgi:uncharacterized membrane protein YgcG